MLSLCVLITEAIHCVQSLLNGELHRHEVVTVSCLGTLVCTKLMHAVVEWRQDIIGLHTLQRYKYTVEIEQRLLWCRRKT